MTTAATFIKKLLACASKPILIPDKDPEATASPELLPIDQPEIAPPVSAVALLLPPAPWFADFTFEEQLLARTEEMQYAALFPAYPNNQPEIAPSICAVCPAASPAPWYADFVFAEQYAAHFPDWEGESQEPATSSSGGSGDMMLLAKEVSSRPEIAPVCAVMLPTESMDHSPSNTAPSPQKSEEVTVDLIVMSTAPLKAAAAGVAGEKDAPKRIDWKQPKAHHLRKIFSWHGLDIMIKGCFQPSGQN